MRGNLKILWSVLQFGFIKKYINMSEPYWTERLKTTQLSSSLTSSSSISGESNITHRPILSTTDATSGGGTVTSTFGTIPSTTTTTPSMIASPYRTEGSILPSDQEQRHRSPKWWLPGGEYAKTVIDYFKGLRG